MNKVNGEFAAVVRAAAELEKQRRKLDTLEGFKLSPSAFFREALAAARSTPERISKLRGLLESNSPGLDAARSTLLKMVRAYRSPNWSGPPAELRRLNYLLSDGADAEVAALGFSVFELSCVAAQLTAEKHPQDFGEAESSQGVQQRLLELTLKRDQLFQRIASEFAPDDLLLDDWDAAGKCRASFKMTNGEVSIAPKADAGKRLVDWVLSH